MPLPWPLACENENSTVFVVRSVNAPEKLTGMPWSEVEILPVPHATELSFVVLVTSR